MKPSRRGASETSGAFGRRSLLCRALGLGAGLSAWILGGSALTGCTPSDPRVDTAGRTLPPPGSRTSAPTSPPAPPSQALTAELALADLAAAILTGANRARLTAVQRGVLVAVHDAHAQHVQALRSPQPTAPPVTPASSPPPSGAPPPAGFTKLNLAQSISLLAGSEKAQSARLRRDALGAAGFEALLLGSMMTAALSFASALGSKTTVPTATAARSHPPMAAGSDIEAIQSMVRQLHAIVYGYQLALGHLSESSATGKRALGALRMRRLLRDELIQILVARAASVPVSAPAYVVPIEPSTPSRSVRLIRLMETALEPFCGLWLAAATTRQDRTLAIDALADTAATARSWGAPLDVWPGWQG